MNKEQKKEREDDLLKILLITEKKKRYRSPYPSCQVYACPGSLIVEGTSKKSQARFCSIVKSGCVQGPSPPKPAGEKKPG
jgi:hypothetical protein